MMLYGLFLVISVLLIAITLLQGGKSGGASAAITGGLGLFNDRKERGVELFFTRFTMVVGAAFFILAFALEFIM